MFNLQRWHSTLYHRFLNYYGNRIKQMDRLQFCKIWEICAIVIGDNIMNIMISVRYNVELSAFYPTKWLWSQYLNPVQSNCQKEVSYSCCSQIAILKFDIYQSVISLYWDKWVTEKTNKQTNSRKNKKNSYSLYGKSVEIEDPWYSTDRYIYM